jgi:hypothetical protein
MKKIALISGLLFLVVYFWVNTFNPEEKTFDVVYPSVPVSTLSVMENPLPAVTNKPDPDQVDSEPVRYSYLIVASFSDPDQANRVAEEFAGRYNSDMFVLPPSSKGYYRVSHGRYSTASEALSALETLKQTHFPDAWMLTSK